MADTGRYRTEPEDLLTKIRNLEKRISKLERSPQLPSSAIDSQGIDIFDGAIRARDASGTIVAQFGKQDDSTYGVTVLENGEMVPPAALLNHYVYVDTVSVQETYTSTSFGDLATFGPQVTVPVRSTGRILVICTTQMQWVSTAFGISIAGGGWTTIQMDGPANFMTTATASVVLLPSFNATHTVSAGTIADANQVTTTAAEVFDGLNPGETIITMKYRNQIGGQDIDYGRRTLVVITL
jgi:hypothetical protein